MENKKSDYIYDPQSGSELMSVEQVGDYLGYNRASIWRLVSKKELAPYKKVGKTCLFLKNDILRFQATNAWAAKKASIEMMENPPEEPPNKLEAVVRVDIGIGFPDILKPDPDFIWEKIPMIKAEVSTIYGNRAFTISIKSPDGGLWEIEYQPPTLIEKIIDKIKTRIKKK